MSVTEFRPALPGFQPNLTDFLSVPAPRRLIVGRPISGNLRLIPLRYEQLGEFTTISLQTGMSSTGGEDFGERAAADTHGVPLALEI